MLFFTYLQQTSATENVKNSRKWNVEKSIHINVVTNSKSQNACVHLAAAAKLMQQWLTAPTNSAAC